MAGMGSILDRGGSSDSGQPPDGIVADRCLLPDPAPDRNHSAGLFALPFNNSLVMSGFPAAVARGGNQSRPDIMPLETEFGFTGPASE